MKCKLCSKNNKEGIKKCLGCKKYIGICPHCLEESTFVDEIDSSFKTFGKNVFRRLGYWFKKLSNLELDLQEGYLLCINCKDDVLICTECLSPMLPTQTKCNECGFLRTIGVQKLVQVTQGVKG